jgi:hypothetical protein
MRTFLYTAVFTVVLLLELFVAAMPLMSGNPARVSFRHEERFAAWKAMGANRSPQTEAAFFNELRLASRYEIKQKLPKCAATFAAFLLLNAVCLYPYWRARHGKNIPGPALHTHERRN